ncbi:MAG TPA: DUF1844 domain-containing protein [Candidatus Polarisedimenticolia bacterium]|nr:DUF1844 domain-containing protein [Candidatus Polarisedimenticolia bacterium]
MSEAKDPQRKREEIRIVDRRAFTQEGERRVPDAPPEEAAPAAPAGSVRTANSREASRGARRETRGAPEGAPPSREEQAASAQLKNLILNLATTAAANLGEMPNPFTQRTELDLEGARQVIDLLLGLQLKTRGNLNAEEARLLESLLYDLQMKYVSLQTKASKPS